MLGHLMVAWWAVVPFGLLLLCIALCPLLPKVNHFWEHNRWKAVPSFVLGGAVAVWMVWLGNSHGPAHELAEYAKFMVLLLCLFAISANICVTGDIPATPRNNTLWLALGALLASVIGTTGAAMVLIRPLLRTNQQREHVRHTVIFTIFIVANCGGLLLPVGDPPLYLGFLRGVPFFWTLSLWPWWLLMNGLLLLAYFSVDCSFYAREAPRKLVRDAIEVEPLRVLGGIHLLWLIGVVVAVAVPALTSPWKEAVMLGMVAGSYLTRNREALQRNHFSWQPMIEVAVLFFGIFQTMVPALIYLRQVAPELPLTPLTFFAFTGSLSSFLDNAPTYVVFFEMASELGGEPSVGVTGGGIALSSLIAISVAAVFCGAFTYIGNGPNFMVKAIAEQRGVMMPTFFGYLLYSIRYLLPPLVAAVLLLLVQTPAALVSGGLLVAALVGISVARVIRSRRVRHAVEYQGVSLEPEMA